MRVSILTKMYVTHLINLEGGGGGGGFSPPGSDSDDAWNFHTTLVQNEFEVTERGV